MTTDTATPSLAPTGGSTLQWVTPAPNRTPTITPIPDTIVQCLDIGPEMSLESVATGGIVVISPRDSSPYLLDLRTGQSRVLPMYAPDFYLLDSMGVSPDRGKLAYVETIRNQANEIVGRQLRVVTADGQVQVSQTFELGWSWWRWLDNERLEIYWWEAVLVDIDKGIANRIPYNESPVGWMRSIP